MRTERPVYPMLLDFIKIKTYGDEYKLRSSSSLSILQSPVTLTVLSLNILLSTLLSNNINLCYSLNVKQQVSHKSKTTRKTVLCTFVYKQKIKN
jgi:hypothetical protein